MESRRNPGLDTLRAAAILMVIARHAVESLRRPLPDFFNSGWAGVDLFFVLSGFLIGTQLFAEGRQHGAVDARRFYLKRAFRILPAYFVVLALHAIWPAFANHEQLKRPWAFLLFVSNIGWTGGAFSHAWSLNVEEHFYLALPLLVTLNLWRPRWFRPAWLFVFVLLGGALLRHHMLSILAPWSASIYRPTYTHLDGLAVGAGIAWLRLGNGKVWQQLTARPWLMNGVGCVVAAAGMWEFQGQKGTGAAVLAFPLVAFGFGALVISALSPNSWLARVRLPGIKGIALAAYSLYLTHKGMIALGLDLAGGREHFGAALLYSIGLIPVGAAVLYFLVERPMLRLRDRVMGHSVGDAPLGLSPDGGDLVVVERPAGRAAGH